MWPSDPSGTAAAVESVSSVLLCHWVGVDTLQSIQWHHGGVEGGSAAEPGTEQDGGRGAVQADAGCALMPPGQLRCPLKCF